MNLASPAGPLVEQTGKVRGRGGAAACRPLGIRMKGGYPGIESLPVIQSTLETEFNSFQGDEGQCIACSVL